MVSCLAEEVKRPQRDLPLGIVGSLAIASSTCSVEADSVSPPQVFTQLGQSAPIVAAFDAVGYHWACYIVSVGAVLGTVTATFSGLLGQPRIFYRMAKDGLLFPLFCKVSAKTGVPVLGTLITGLVTTGIAFFCSLELLADNISLPCHRSPSARCARSAS
eukprot:TRINITY_DN558_c0_g1_i4.p3 TRINITY_DN558_c0_g1~~TRINITY_DN558_c0_g1_i4.p3  ORF type:complete len:160 (-),score=36.78 TRINITY_DN558_c0_g1_i4:1455-1934(-)